MSTVKRSFTGNSHNSSSQHRHQKTKHVRFDKNNSKSRATNNRNHSTNKQRERKSKSKSSHSSHLIRDIFEDSSDSSDDEPIINRFNQQNYESTRQSSTLNRIPKYTSSKQKTTHNSTIQNTNKNTIKRILPAKRPNSTNSNSSMPIQPHKKRKINNQPERSPHSPLRRPKRKNNKHTITNQNKAITTIKTLNNSPPPKPMPPKPIRKIITKIKSNKEPIIIDLLSDSDDNIDNNTIISSTVNKRNNNQITNTNKGNMICFSHNRYEKAIIILNIPTNVFEHQLVENFQLRYGIKVIQCDEFKMDNNNKPFKKCSRFELLDTQQRDYLLEISKKGQLKISRDRMLMPKYKHISRPIAMKKDIDINMSMTPPVAPKTCAVYYQKKTNTINNINMDNENYEMDLNMELTAIKWMNRFPIFGCDEVTPLISSQEIINIPSFANHIHIDNDNQAPQQLASVNVPAIIDNIRQNNEHKNDELISSLSHSVSSSTNNEMNQFSLMTNTFNTVSAQNEGWSFYLCVEEAMNTESASNGDIVPMIQVIVDKTRLKLHERCDKMIWFQRKDQIPTKYCEWIENDVFDPTFSELIDLRYIGPHMDRGNKQLVSFRKELNKHNATFINPSIFDGEYYIGLKVLAVIEHMLGGTIIKAKIMKITIPTSINHVSDVSFTTSLPSIPSTDTFTTATI